MARFIADMPTGKPDDMVRFIAEDYLKKEGFKQITYKNELVWKKGNGLVTGPQFIKLETFNGNVHLEAWLKNALLPGVYVGEMGLDGAYAVVLKQTLKGRVDALARLLYQPVTPAVEAPVMAVPAEPVPQQAAVPAPPAEGYVQPAAPQTSAPPMDPMPAQPAYNTQPGYGVPAQQPYSGPQTPYYPPVQPVQVAVHDPKDKATLCLIMGLVSILGCFIPIVGVATGVAGIIAGKSGRQSSARAMATVGLVLSIVMLIVSVLNWAAGIYINMIRL